MVLSSAPSANRHTSVVRSRATYSNMWRSEWQRVGKTSAQAVENEKGQRMTPSEQQPSRVASVDVFRGLTMLLMLFVNDIGDLDLGHIQNAPQWLKHMPAAVDGMTVADVIFPCFLFISGLSIPLALERRLAAGASLARILGHVLARASAMIAIGLLMVNSCHGYAAFEAAAMPLSPAVWRLLMFASVVALWARYPSLPGAKRWLPLGARIGAALVLAYLLAIYRVPSDGGEIWLRPRWWGIVGLCGWAYLFAAPLWLACRSRTAALLGAFALLIALNIGLRFGALGGWARVVQTAQGWLPGLGLGAQASMVVAGLVIAALHHPRTGAPTARGRLGGTLLFGLGCALAGLLLRQPWGIHKSGGTPAWVLLSMGVACAAYALLHGLVDVKRVTRGLAPFACAGSNTLLMYLLPCLFYSVLAALGIDWLKTHLNEGWPGVARSGAVALLLLGTTVLLTRVGLRLKV